MSKHFRLSTALDVDDLLLECIPYAIKLANEKYNFNPPLTIHEVNRWGKLGTRADVIFEYFNDPEFYKNQPVIEGAKESSNYILTKYSSTHKSSKEDEWEKVELTKIFNDEKEPISDVEVTYNKGRFYED